MTMTERLDRVKRQYDDERSRPAGRTARRNEAANEAAKEAKKPATLGPTELVRAAGVTCDLAAMARFDGYRQTATFYRRKAQDLIDQADRLRGLHLEPGYTPCRLDVNATASKIA